MKDLAGSLKEPRFLALLVCLILTAIGAGICEFPATYGDYSMVMSVVCVLCVVFYFLMEQVFWMVIAFALMLYYTPIWVSGADNEGDSDSHRTGYAFMIMGMWGAFVAMTPQDFIDGCKTLITMSGIPMLLIWIFNFIGCCILWDQNQNGIGTVCFILSFLFLLAGFGNKTALWLSYWTLASTQVGLLGIGVNEGYTDAARAGAVICWIAFLAALLYLILVADKEAGKLGFNLQLSKTTILLLLCLFCAIVGAIVFSHKTDQSDAMKWNLACLVFASALCLFGYLQGSQATDVFIVIVLSIVFNITPSIFQTICQHGYMIESDYPFNEFEPKSKSEKLFTGALLLLFASCFQFFFAKCESKHFSNARANIFAKLLALAGIVFVIIGLILCWNDMDSSRAYGSMPTTWGSFLLSVFFFALHFMAADPQNYYLIVAIFAQAYFQNDLMNSTIIVGENDGSIAVDDKDKMLAGFVMQWLGFIAMIVCSCLSAKGQEEGQQQQGQQQGQQQKQQEQQQGEPQQIVVGGNENV